MLKHASIADWKKISSIFRRVLYSAMGVGLRGVQFTECPEVRYALRKKSKRRAFMHVGHCPGNVVCVHPRAGKLSREFLTGLFLHEFGHLATPGGSEQDADQWAFEKLGVLIEYKGPLCLEWARL